MISLIWIIFLSQTLDCKHTQNILLTDKASHLSKINFMPATWNMLCLTLMLTAWPQISLIQVNVLLGLMQFLARFFEHISVNWQVSALTFSTCSGSDCNTHLSEDHHCYPPSCPVALTPVSLKCCDPFQGLCGTLDPQQSACATVDLKKCSMTYIRNVVCWLSLNI